MHNHFDRHLNLRSIILEKRPEVIVECGAGNGDCTKLLAHMKHYYPFDLRVISDKVLDGLDPSIKWINGLSYNVLSKFKDDSIGMCIIDTDHNWWTLTKELEAVGPKMKEGGLIVMHDVDEFYHNSGMSLSYWDGEPYPEKEIRECLREGGVGLGLIDFLARHRAQFKLLRYVPESNGAAVIEKKTVGLTMLYTPGSHPVFAKTESKGVEHAVSGR